MQATVARAVRWPHRSPPVTTNSISKDRGSLTRGHTPAYSYYLRNCFRSGWRNRVLRCGIWPNRKRLGTALSTRRGISCRANRLVVNDQPFTTIEADDFQRDLNTRSFQYSLRFVSSDSNRSCTPLCTDEPFCYLFAAGASTLDCIRASCTLNA